jgi:hypothetical protein
MKSIQITAAEYEMLLAISRKIMKKPEKVISEYLIRTYTGLKL